MRIKRSFFLAAASLLIFICNAMSVWGALEPAVCTGQIYGANGKPPLMANVRVTEIGGTYQNPIFIVPMDASGKFETKLKGPGYYMIWISAPNYEKVSFPIYITYNDTKIDFKVTLNPYTYNAKFKEVKIIGDWNKFNIKKAEVMRKKINGTYVYEREVAGDTVSYQLIGIVGEDRPVNGTMAHEFVDDGNGDYRSVLKVKPGKVKIVFEPSKIYRPKNKDLPKLPVISFDDQHKSLEKLPEMADLYEKTYNEYQAAMELYRETHGDSAGFTYDYSKLQSYLENEFKNSKEIYIREFAAFNLIRMKKMGLNLGSTKDTEIFKVIPPGHELWGIDPNLIVMASKGFNKDAIDYILWYFVMQNPNRHVQARALATLAARALEEGDKERVRTIYRELSENYADIKDVRSDLLYLNPDKRIQNGKPVPEFAVKLIDGKTVITNKDFLGKYYLINFWASWCSHCQSEMLFLHKVYEKFHGKDFEIISLSIDKTIDDLNEFRKEKWPMPWLHVFLEEGWDNKTAFDFEVQTIPRMTLVGPDGKILAVNDELKGELLEKTLEGILGNP